MSLVAQSAVESVAPPAAWIGRAAKEWGIFAVMCGFFVWWSYAREGTLNARIDAQDVFIRETLVQALDANTKAIEGFRSVLERKADKP